MAGGQARGLALPGLIPVVSAVVTALLLAGCQPDVAHEPDSLAPVIQLRLARETPAPGFVYMDAPPPDTGIYVDERVVVSDEQIAYVRVERRGNDVLLDVRLTPDGAARLAAVTSTRFAGGLGWRDHEPHRIARPQHWNGWTGFAAGRRGRDRRRRGGAVAAVSVDARYGLMTWPVSLSSFRYSAPNPSVRLAWQAPPPLTDLSLDRLRLLCRAPSRESAAEAAPSRAFRPGPATGGRQPRAHIQYPTPTALQRNRMNGVAWPNAFATSSANDVLVTSRSLSRRTAMKSVRRRSSIIGSSGE